MENTTTVPGALVAFAKAQSQFSPALKDTKNPFFKSSYADLSSIWNAVSEALNTNGLFILQPIRMTESGGVLVETILMHESGVEVGRCECPVIPKAANDPQALGSAITYARRYSLASLLCVVTDDDDAESASGRGNDLSKRHPYEKPHEPTARTIEPPKDFTKRIEGYKADIEKIEASDFASFDGLEKTISNDTDLSPAQKSEIVKPLLLKRVAGVTDITSAQILLDSLVRWAQAGCVSKDNATAIKDDLLTFTANMGITLAGKKFVVSEAKQAA